jgi:exonuclease III
MEKLDIDIFSLNVNGLGDKVKRMTVITKLKELCKGIIFLQETHTVEGTEPMWCNIWGNSNIKFSHGTTNSRGVAILFSRELQFNILQEFSDKEGRFIILDVELNGQILTLVNLYAPTRNFENEQIETFHLLCESLQDFKKENLIFGGDFNLHLNPRLDKLDNSDSGDNPKFRAEILSFLETENLVDIWRVFNPSARIFTWHRGTKQKSRLDYFFTAEHLLNIAINTEILPGIHSDHSLLKLTIGNASERTGRGFWKFNTSLLHDEEYVKNIKNIIRSTGETYSNINDKGLIWEMIKLNVRNYTIPYSAIKKKKQNELLFDLNKRYTELHSIVLSDSATQQITDDYNIIKHEIELIEKHIARGAMLRSKCRWIEEGERNTSFFLRLERNNYLNKSLSQLEINNEKITNPKKILDAAGNFYENLYSEKIDHNTDIFNENTSQFTESSSIPKISEESKQTCDTDLSESELLESLKGLKNGKSPGSDGLPSEFYKFFWIDIKVYLLESLKYSLLTGELSIEQKRGIITLIPKKDKNRFYLKNWRPITLLNSDYKILTKALANRICSVLPNIIDEDQTGYIKGRFIGCNIRLIEDIITFTDKNNLPGILLNIDFEKAFDSINWKFIEKSLEAFNFGNKFISYIKTIYTNISSAVINNGNISDWFSLGRGVRQGCPISPYLFILAVELLAINIRENKNIRGITIDGTEIKVSQLADDTSCFLLDFESLARLLSIFEKFKQCAGLKINVDKTNARYLGSLKGVRDFPFGLDWSGATVSSLGVTFTGNEHDHYEQNFKKRILNMKHLLTTWKCRKLSLKGKVTVVNTLALSPLLYLASVIYVPNVVFKEVKDLIVNFMWDGGSSKIAYDILIQQIEDGGLKLVDFEDKVKSLKVMWVKRFSDESKGRWKAAPRFFYKTSNLERYFNFNTGKVKLTYKFYEEIKKCWTELQHFDLANSQSILNQCIWNNKYITMNNKPIIWEKWIQHGIMYIQDIVSDKCVFLSHTEINDRYHVGSNFLNVLQLRKSIPGTWRAAIYETDNKKYRSCGEGALLIDQNGITHNIKTANCKQIYWIYVNKKLREPSSVKKWLIDYPGFKNADQALWKNIYHLAFNITRETKLQSLQYRLIHRTITCRKKLYDMKLSDNPQCLFCDNLDDITHFFLFCDKTQDFWHSFLLWWNRTSDMKIPFDYVTLEVSILFGFQSNGDIFHALNYCILVAKSFVHRQKLFYDNELDFYDYLCELKYKLEIERNICSKNGNHELFSKFAFIYDNLLGRSSYAVTVDQQEIIRVMPMSTAFLA